MKINDLKEISNNWKLRIALSNIKKENNELYILKKEIEHLTDFLPKNSFISERLYCIINNLNQIPKCRNCKINNVRWLKKKNKYSKYCCNECINPKQVSEIGQQNNLKKYGVKSTLMLKEVSDKIKDTCIKKYGVDNPIKNKEIHRKMIINQIKNNSFNLTSKSKISQELFFNIYNSINKKNIYFYDLNSEYWIQGKNFYFVDFIDLDSKKIIEFNGDKFHANPDLYTENDAPNPFKRNLKAKDIWANDKNRLEDLKSLGYSVKIVWENDYKTNKEKIIKECIGWLNDN